MTTHPYGEVGNLSGHLEMVTAVAYSPDGLRIASGSRDGALRIWGVSTAICVVGPLRAHTEKIDSVTFSPNGRWIVSRSKDGVVHLWDATSGDLEHHAVIDSSSATAFSPDGLLCASGFGDGTVRVWDWSTKQTVFASGPSELGHGGAAVTSLAFSPDGRCLASFSQHGLVISYFREDWNRL